AARLQPSVLPAAVAAVALHEATHRTLARVDLRVSQGAFVGVLTTDPRDAEALIDLLTGRAQDTEDTVRIGGTPVSEIDLDSLRSTVLVEQHGSVLFEGTLRSNLVDRKSVG